MPIYDFKCQECGMISEMFFRYSGQATHCPNCGSENMERLISASYMVKTDVVAPGATCCGRTERCDTPPCSTDKGCQRH